MVNFPHLQDIPEDRLQNEFDFWYQEVGSAQTEWGRANAREMLKEIEEELERRKK